MLHKNFNIFLFICSLALNSYAGLDGLRNKLLNINGKDIKAEYVVKDLIRISKSRPPEHIEAELIPTNYGEVPAKNSGPSEICIECEDMTKFTSQVADIIHKFSKESEGKNNKGSIELKQESFKLKAVVDYLKLVDKHGNESCISNHMLDGRTIYEPELFEDLNLLFTSDVDLSQFESMTISNKSMADTHITWFKAQDATGEDIFIKVVNFKSKPPYFQVYSVGASYIDPEKKVAPKVSKAQSDKKEEDSKSSKRKERSYIKDHTIDTMLGTVKINKALHVRQDYYVPTRLTLIDMNTESHPSESTTIRSKLEVTDRRQKAEVSMDNKVTENVSLKSKLNVSPKGQELNVEMNIKNGPKTTAQLKSDGTYVAGIYVATPEFSNFEFDTDMSYDSNNITTVKNNVRFKGSTIVQTGTVLHKDGRVDFRAGRSIDVFDNAVVTMEVKQSSRDRIDQGGRTSAYISFDMKF